MFAILKQSLFSKSQQDSLLRDSKAFEIKIKTKQISSQIVKQQKQPKSFKLIKSQPVLQSIHQEARQIHDLIRKRSPNSPRFIRTTNPQTSKNRLKITFKYQSPTPRNAVLIHQPVQTKKQQQNPGFRRQVIPPSDLNHDKMKNFEQNPQKFLLNIDESLDKVFKKSVQSIIRTAQVLPVKDSQIRDSTDLLSGYRQK